MEGRRHCQRDRLKIESMGGRKGKGRKKRERERDRQTDREWLGMGMNGQEKWKDEVRRGSHGWIDKRTDR